MPRNNIHFLKKEIIKQNKVEMKKSVIKVKQNKKSHKPTINRGEQL